MKIDADFIKGNERISIISNGGVPTPIPLEWRPILGGTHMIVVVPDMHMYKAGDDLDNFKWGAEQMLSFLSHVQDIKDQMDLNNQLLRVYQIGDMYELRFPGRTANATVSEIKLSSDDYSQILDAFQKLYTNKLYGNHDFENRHFPGCSFSFTEGKIYLEHGFAADEWPANPKNPLWDPAMLVFLDIRKLNEFFDKLLGRLDLLNPDGPKSWGVTSGSKSNASFPSVTKYEKNFKAIKQFYVSRMRSKVNGPDCRITIIGHTHMPHLDPNVDGEHHIFVDSGAWTEGRSDFVVVTDEELAICHYKRKQT